MNNKAFAACSIIGVAALALAVALAVADRGGGSAQAAAQSTEQRAADWEEHCEPLQQDRERLAVEAAEIQADRDRLHSEQADVWNRPAESEAARAAAEAELAAAQADIDRRYSENAAASATASVRFDYICSPATHLNISGSVGY